MPAIPPLPLALHYPAHAKPGHRRTYSPLAFTVLDPAAIVDRPPSERAVWDIDAATGTVRLREPPNSLEHFAPPLQPMIGCFGVAFAFGQARRHRHRDLVRDGNVVSRPEAEDHLPRGETADDIFTIGNARPLDQAPQHATTEMLRWLDEDNGLDARAASHAMGQVVRNDIGNVFNPAFTVACPIAERWLTKQ
jgi:amidase